MKCLGCGTTCIEGASFCHNCGVGGVETSCAQSTEESAMAILLPCTCGSVYNLKSEYAGMLLQCPACGTVMHTPRLSEETMLQPLSNNWFILRQKFLSLDSQYNIRDREGKELLYARRPSRWFIRFLLLLLCLGLLVKLASIGKLALWFIPVVLIVYYFCNIKRDITLYDSCSRQHLLLTIKQDAFFQGTRIRYSLYDQNGFRLGCYEKKRLSDLLRRKWQFSTPDGQVLLTAEEDSLIASLLRRVTGYFFDFAFFRTNFIYFAGQSKQVVGELNKRISLVDKYTLDLTQDVEGWVDRRVSLGLGLLLDSGEGR